MPNRLMQQYHRARVFRVAGARGRSVFVLFFRGLPEWMRAFRSLEEARKGCSFVELGSFASSFSIRGFSAVALLLVGEASRVEDGLYLSSHPLKGMRGGASDAGSERRDALLRSTPCGSRGILL
jgi:hypothetical protein